MASLSQKQQQQQRAISPHRTVVWTEPKPNNSSARRKAVPVVYYLCREDGQLEHPHFMEVSSSDGRLCLRDFTERLDMLRGKGMAAMYSWSSKRSYRNQGFVWHDLTEDDIIHPTHANEYVLKGSHRFSSSFFSSHGRRRNWSSFDLAEYKHQHQQVSSLATDEISPPPSSSSPDDTLDVRATAQKKEVIAGVRIRASSVLTQLISCSSVTVKKSHSHQKNKIPAASPSLGCSSAHHDGGDRDYFSGSLIDETSNNNNNNNKTTAAALKRSSSCNIGT